VIRRDKVVVHVRIGIGIAESNHRDAQLASFFDGDQVSFTVDDKEDIWRSAEVLDPSEGAFQFLNFFFKLGSFLLGILLKFTRCLLLLEVFEVTDSFLHRVKVGQKSAEPFLRHIREVVGFCELRHHLSSLRLGRDEEDGFPVFYGLLDEVEHFFQMRLRLIQIKDVNSIDLTIDVGLHFWVPLLRTMTKMHSILDHFFNRKCHILGVKRQTTSLRLLYLKSLKQEAG